MHRHSDGGGPPCRTEERDMFETLLVFMVSVQNFSQQSYKVLITTMTTEEFHFVSFIHCHSEYERRLHV